MKRREPNPPPARRIIDRPRLLNQLEETSARTILLLAPAGYGKTTLLRQWTELHPSIRWYSAGAGSSDLAQLAIGLAATYEPFSPGLQKYVSEVVGALSNPTRQLDHIVEAFVATLAETEVGTTIVDDYHLLCTTTSAEQLVRELSDRLGLRLVLGSRMRPSWATARAAIYGEHLEIGSDELALTPAEATDVLADAPAAVSSLLLAQGNGWPAVIGLAALSRNPTRAPSDAVSTTLFRFFAEELFTSAPDVLQEQLPQMALLPSLTEEITDLVFGEAAPGLLASAVAQGFATPGSGQHDLHPLIREYLLSKLSLHSDVDARVSDAIQFSMSVESWDNAFALITRFNRVDLLETFLESAFNPLARSGRISTLEQVAAFARSRSVDFSPSIALIDAELALRDGFFARAEALATGAAKALGPAHVLTAHAHWVAGQAAQLSTSYSTAPIHFRLAHETAKDEDDVRDALWGLMLTSIYSEAPDAADHVLALQDRRENSAVDLVRATAAVIAFRRYTTGFVEPLDSESALYNLGSVSDPHIRTSFRNTYAYCLILRAEYDEAYKTAELMLADASQYQLSWAIPHAEWALAAAAFGYRDFNRADRLLHRVERAAAVLDDTHLILNASALRARFLVSLQRSREAYDALVADGSSPASPAMKAEVAATRALVSGVLGEFEMAERDADEASTMTTSIDVQALVACARALCRPSEATARSAFDVAEGYGAWDALICAMRAKPQLLEVLATIDACRPRLQTLLRSSNDFDLARHAGIPVGPRPRLREAPLTPRERDVAQLIAQGLSNKEIASTLFLSNGTVKSHVRHIFEKTGARTRTDAARRAMFDSY